MVKQMLSFFLVFVAISNGFSQNLASKESDDYIKKINNKVTEIKSAINTFKVQVANYDEGVSGTRTSYYQGDVLQLIIAKVMENGVEKTVEWYFSEGNLIYSESNWKGATSKKELGEEKLYLQNGKLFQWISKGQIIDPNSEEFKKTDKEIQKYKN